MSLFMDLPLIIPRKRLMSAIIGILIASSIFVTTNSVLFSMTEVSEDLFGTSEDVVVFYNTHTTTPFTSRVSEMFEDAFTQVRGVEIVSPEIFQPVTINDQSAYARGVDFGKIKLLDGIQIQDGEVRLQKNPNSAVIGSALARRLDVVPGQVIELASIITEERVQVTVTGVYTSASISDDELLINPALAREIGGLEDNFVSHMRIKFDPSIASGESILSLGQELHDVQVQFDIKNSTSQEDLNFRVTQQRGIEIADLTGISKIHNLDLLSGNYRFELLEGNTVLFNSSKLITSDIDIPISAGKNLYPVHFNITYDNLPVNNVPLEITQEGRLIDSITLSEGYANSSLTRGNYSAVIQEDFDTYSFNISVYESMSVKKDFDYSPISFPFFENNSLYVSNELPLQYDYLDGDFDYFINGSKIDSFQSIANSSLDLSLPDGTYSFSVFYNEKKYRSFQFTVNSSHLYFDADIKNYDYVTIGDEISFRIDGIMPDTLLSNFPYELNQDSILVDTSQSTPGIYPVVVRGSNFFNQDVYRVYHIQLVSPDQTLSWKHGAKFPIVKQGDNLTFWSSSNPTLNISNTELLSSDGSEYLLNITNGSTELNTTHAVSNLEDMLYFKYVSNYSSLFRLNSLNIRGGMKVQNSTLQLEFPDYPIPFQSMYFWQVDYVYSGKTYQIFHDQVFYINVTNGFQDLTISFTNLITETKESITVSVNSTITYGFENKISGISPYFLSGDVHLDNWRHYKYEIFRDSEPYIPINISDSILRFGPGNYSLQLVNFPYVWWNFTVLQWSYQQSVNYVTSSSGYIDSNALIRSSGVFFSSSIYRIGGMNPVEYEIIRNFEQDKITIEFAYVVEGEVSIFYNGTFQGQTVLNSTTVELDGSVHGTYQLNLTYRTMRNQSKSLDFSLPAKLQVRNYTLQINGLQFPNQNFDVEIYFNSSRDSLIFSGISEIDRIEFQSISQEMAIQIKENKQTIYSNQFNLGNETFLDIIFGLSYVNLNITNQNYRELSDLVEYIKISANNLFYQLDKNFDRIMKLPYNSYSIELHTFSGLLFNMEFTPSGNQTLSIDLPLFESKVKLQVLKLKAPLSAQVQLTHQLLGLVSSSLISFRNPTVQIQIPLGEYSILLNGSWGSVSQGFNVNQKGQIIPIVVELEENKEYEIDIDQALRLDQVGISFSSDYLDNYLRGALVIIQSIIITEIVVMLVIIFANFNEIIRFMIVESKKELRILDRLGASKLQIMIGFIKPMFVLGVALPIVSLFVSHILLNLIFSLELTVFFGHQFTPSVTNPFVIISNFVITYGMTIISTATSLNLELYSERENE